MATDYVMPDTQSIASILEMIFGEGVEVTDAEVIDFDDKHVATFMSREQELVALCACDLPFVAYSGAALSMIPANTAKDMANGGGLTEAVLSNFHEVMNICSKLMMSETSAHLRLDKTLAPDQSASAVTALDASASTSVFNVDIPRYGKGVLAFSIA